MSREVSIIAVPSSVSTTTTTAVSRHHKVPRLNASSLCVAHVDEANVAEVEPVHGCVPRSVSSGSTRSSGSGGDGGSGCAASSSNGSSVQVVCKGIQLADNAAAVSTHVGLADPSKYHHCHQTHPVCVPFSSSSFIADEQLRCSAEAAVETEFPLDFSTSPRGRHTTAPPSAGDSCVSTSAMTTGNGEDSLHDDTNLDRGSSNNNSSGSGEEQLPEAVPRLCITPPCRNAFPVVSAVGEAAVKSEDGTAPTAAAMTASGGRRSGVGADSPSHAAPAPQSQRYFQQRAKLKTVLRLVPPILAASPAAGDGDAAALTPLEIVRKTLYDQDDNERHDGPRRILSEDDGDAPAPRVLHTARGSRDATVVLEGEEAAREALTPTTATPGTAAWPSSGAGFPRASSSPLQPPSCPSPSSSSNSNTNGSGGRNTAAAALPPPPPIAATRSRRFSSAIAPSPLQLFSADRRVTASSTRSSLISTPIAAAVPAYALSPTSVHGLTRVPSHRTTGPTASSPSSALSMARPSPQAVVSTTTHSRNRDRDSQSHSNSVNSSSSSYHISAKSATATPQTAALLFARARPTHTTATTAGEEEEVDENALAVTTASASLFVQHADPQPSPTRGSKRNLSHCIRQSIISSCTAQRGPGTAQQRFRDGWTMVFVRFLLAVVGPHVCLLYILPRFLPQQAATAAEEAAQSPSVNLYFLTRPHPECGLFLLEFIVALVCVVGILWQCRVCGSSAFLPSFPLKCEAAGEYRTCLTRSWIQQPLRHLHVKKGSTSSPVAAATAATTMVAMRPRSCSGGGGGHLSRGPPHPSPCLRYSAPTSPTTVQAVASANSHLTPLKDPQEHSANSEMFFGAPTAALVGGSRDGESASGVYAMLPAASSTLKSRSTTVFSGSGGANGAVAVVPMSHAKLSPSSPSLSSSMDASNNNYNSSGSPAATTTSESPQSAKLPLTPPRHPARVGGGVHVVASSAVNVGAEGFNAVGESSSNFGTPTRQQKSPKRLPHRDAAHVGGRGGGGAALCAKPSFVLMGLSLGFLICTGLSAWRLSVDFYFAWFNFQFDTNAAFWFWLAPSAVIALVSFVLLFGLGHYYRYRLASMVALLLVQSPFTTCSSKDHDCDNREGDHDHAVQRHHPNTKLTAAAAVVVSELETLRWLPWCACCVPHPLPEVPASYTETTPPAGVSSAPSVVAAATAAATHTRWQRPSASHLSGHGFTTVSCDDVRRAPSAAAWDDEEAVAVRVDSSLSWSCSASYNASRSGYDGDALREQSSNSNGNFVFSPRRGSTPRKQASRHAADVSEAVRVSRESSLLPLTGHRRRSGSSRSNSSSSSSSTWSNESTFHSDSDDKSMSAVFAATATAGSRTIFEDATVVAASTSHTRSADNVWAGWRTSPATAAPTTTQFPSAAGASRVVPPVTSAVVFTTLPPSPLRPPNGARQQQSRRRPAAAAAAAVLSVTDRLRYWRDRLHIPDFLMRVRRLLGRRLRCCSECRALLSPRTGRDKDTRDSAAAAAAAATALPASLTTSASAQECSAFSAPHIRHLARLRSFLAATYLVLLLSFTNVLAALLYFTWQWRRIIERAASSAMYAVDVAAAAAEAPAAALPGHVAHPYLNDYRCTTAQRAVRSVLWVVPPICVGGPVTPDDRLLTEWSLSNRAALLLTLLSRRSFEAAYLYTNVALPIGFACVVYHLMQELRLYAQSRRLLRLLAMTRARVEVMRKNREMMV